LEKDEHVRLAGIDTPEIRTKDLVEKAAGFKAKEFVEQKFAQYGPKMLLVTLKDNGKFGRYVAYVLLDKEGFGNFSYNLNQGLLDEGLAAIY
jgi:Kyanoviridae endonuclease